MAKPTFEQVRRDSVFQSNYILNEDFVVTHDVTIAIYYPDGIGQLIDIFLKLDLLTLTGFDWLPFEVNSC